MKRNIYIPVEVAKREALPKSFLAAALAARGHRVYLFQDYIFDKYGYPGCGIYIGKNIFKTEVPYSVDHYQALKAQRVILFYLDEEGGVYPGAGIPDWRKMLLARTAPETLHDDDHYLAWGEWQAQVFRELSTAKVCVTGSPNYGVCRPAYREALQSVDHIITGGIDGYILINTRFNLANPMIGLGNLTGPGSAASQLFSEGWYASLLALDFQYLGVFVRLTLRLAAAFPSTKIVIRPHPSENRHLYERIFGSCSNVVVNGEGHISTWLRSARVVIHNGCSTALQAVVGCVPVVSYVPFAFDELNMGLPNRVGLRAYTEAEVIAYTEKALAGKLEAAKCDDMATTIADVDTVNRIAELVDGQPEARGRGRITKMRRIQCELALRWQLRRVLRRRSIFDYKEFERSPRYVAAAAEHFGSPVRARAVCRGIYEIAM